MVIFIVKKKLLLSNWIYFFTGAFTALIVGFPLAIGAWSATKEKAMETMVNSFVVMSSLLLVLVLALFFRKKILGLFGFIESSIAQVGESIVIVLGSVVEKDISKATEQTALLTSQILGWYSWATFYRWVINTSITLLVVFGGFAGSVLLFEQNKLLTEQTTQFTFQNQLMVLDVIREIRQFFLLGIDLSMDKQSKRIGKIKYQSKEKEVYLLPNAVKFNNPNRSSIVQVINLGKKDGLTDSVKDALVSLLQDNNPTVVLGALQTLEGLGGHTPKHLKIVLRKINLSDITINSKVDIEISDSIVENFSCENCNIKLINSFAKNINTNKSVILERSWLTQEVNEIEIGEESTNSVIQILESGNSRISIKTTEIFYGLNFCKNDLLLKCS